MAYFQWIILFVVVGKVWSLTWICLDVKLIGFDNLFLFFFPLSSNWIFGLWFGVWNVCSFVISLYLPMFDYTFSAHFTCNTHGLWVLLQLLEDSNERENQELKIQEELESLKDCLRSEKQNLAAVASDCDKFKSLFEEKDSELQVVMVENSKFWCHANVSTFDLKNVLVGYISREAEHGNEACKIESSRVGEQYQKGVGRSK